MVKIVSNMDTSQDRTFQKRAYNYIRERILSLEFKPNMALRMEALAAAIDVSRTPVREALSRLCEAGLVVRDGGWGYTVKPITFKEAMDVYKVREALEVESVREALPRMNKKSLMQLRQCLVTASSRLKRGRKTEFRKCTRQFHQAIARATDNSCLISMLMTIEDRIHLLGAMMADRSDRPQQSLAENYKLLAALEDKDEEAAVTAVRQHVTSAREIITHHLMTQGTGFSL